MFGSDSIVSLTLTINPVDSIHLNDAVCAGSLYSDYGFSFFAPLSTLPSVHYDTIRTLNANGCDSIVTLTLTVNPVDSVHFDGTICAGGTYAEHGFNYTAPYSTLPDIHYDTIRTVNANGCDSIVTLTLTVNPVDSVHFEEAICAGNAYNGHGFTYSAPYSTAPDVHYDTIRTLNANGCDSIITLTLTVNPVDSVHFEEDVCAGNTYNGHGFTYSAPYSTLPDVYYDTIRTVNAIGCDSIVTLTLTVHPVDSVHFDDIICAGTTYSDHGFSYTAPYSTAPDVHYDTIRTVNANGCDSIVTLTLTVNPVDSILLEESVCAGNTYNGYGFTYEAPFSTTPDIYYDTIRTSNANGCDSVVALVLTVNPVDSVNFEESVSAGATYNHHGFTYTAPYTTEVIIHYDTIRTVNANGCDSVVTLALTVNPADSVHFDEAICAGSTYNAHDFIYEAPYSTLPSVYYDTIRTTNMFGSDSIVSLTLTVNPVDSVHIEDTVCAGSTYNNYGFLYEAPFNTSMSVFYDTIRTVNANGCDSIVTLHLVVNNNADSAIYRTACDSFVWNDSTYTATGEYIQHFETIHGCDSIVTLHLSISHSSTSEFSASSCENYTWNNQTYTQSGSYTQVFENAVGCDSTVTLNLTIYNPVHTAVTQLACESYTWHGQTYTQSGTYTYSHTDAHGCTQVDTLHLDIGHPQHTAVTEIACESFTWNGQTYTQSGNYTHSHLDNHGCTQVDTLHLTVNHPVHTAVTEVVCDSYTWNGQTYTQSGNHTYSHTDANGCTQVDTLHLTVHYSAATEEELVLCREELPYTWNDTVFDTDAPESATLVFHFLTVEGCDSTVTLQLTIHDPVHTAESDFACEPYHWNGQTYTESGTYTFAHPDENGCTQVDTLHLTFLDTTIRIVPLTHNFCDEGSLTLEAQCVLEDYLWSTGETSTIITVFEEGTYMVTASQGSCEVSTSYTIHPCEHDILLPNAFTPNGDGINDDFGLPENSLEQIGDAMFNVYIYNRWGTLVYTASSKYFRWNGEVNGQIYHNNIYNYVIEYNTPAGVPRKISGSIMVL